MFFCYEDQFTVGFHKAWHIINKRERISPSLQKNHWSSKCLAIWAIWEFIVKRSCTFCITHTALLLGLWPDCVLWSTFITISKGFSTAVLLSGSMEGFICSSFCSAARILHTKAFVCVQGNMITTGWTLVVMHLSCGL